MLLKKETEEQLASELVSEEIDYVPEHFPTRWTGHLLLGMFYGRIGEKTHFSFSSSLQ